MAGFLRAPTAPVAFFCLKLFVPAYDYITIVVFIQDVVGETRKHWHLRPGRHFERRTAAEAHSPYNGLHHVLPHLLLRVPVPVSTPTAEPVPVSIPTAELAPGRAWSVYLSSVPERTVSIVAAFHATSYNC